MRELRLVFGATTAAVAAVLAIFMAGLGIGSALLGDRADRTRNPLFLYGLLEAAIALSAAASPWLIGLATTIYLRTGGQEALGVLGATVMRLALAAVVLAVPSFLMGGTLPAAVRAVTPANDSHRRGLALLYGANTLGAVFGAAATTLFALEYLGTRATLWLGCALGLGVGTMAIAYSRRIAVPNRCDHHVEESCSRNLSDEDAATSTANPAAGFRSGLIYVAAAVVGFAFFALELVWYRMLAPILGGTAFTFGLILCFALLGIGIGGLTYCLVFKRLQPSWQALAITCGGEALLVMAPYAVGDQLALLAAQFAHAAKSFSELVAGWCIVLCLVVLPVAVISGLQFPLLTGLLGQGGRTVSQHLGRVYAWNTLGAITGSLVAGFGALPILGAIGLWKAVAAILTVLSLAVLAGAADRGSRSVTVVVGLAVLTCGLMFAPGPSAAWRHGGIGGGRANFVLSDPNSIQTWLHERRHGIDWQADGVECSVGIDRNDGLAFIVNGKSDGGALVDAATQIGAAVLGTVLHRDPKSGLVIGLGTGESAGWLTELRGVKQVDVVELEPALDIMADRCRDLNWDVLRHPRIRRIYNDGREFIQTTSNSYDVIFSEPSNPYRAGVATLYTAEFYDTVRRRLNPGGVFVQWLQAYEVDDATVLTVLATARSAFPHVEVWQTLAPDLQLVCSNSPLDYTLAELRERLKADRVGDALAKAWNVHDVEGFLAHFVGSSAWVDAVARVPILVRNTDDRTLLEYSFAKTVGRSTPFSVEALRARLRAAGFHYPTQVTDVDWNAIEVRRQVNNLLCYGELSPALLPRAADQALVEALNRYQANDFAGALSRWPAEHRHPTDDVLRLLLARCYAELGNSECRALISAADERYPVDAAALRAIYYWRAKNATEAANSLETHFQLLHETPWMIPVVSDSAVALAVEISRAAPDAAPELYRQLSQPFSQNRLDLDRQRSRVLVAAQLGPEQVIAALVDLEPNVMWSADVLQARLQAYTTVGHPLAKRAARDWQWFERHRTSN